MTTTFYTAPLFTHATVNNNLAQNDELSES